MNRRSDEGEKQRIIRKVIKNPDTGCWEWQGKKTSQSKNGRHTSLQGYGVIHFRGKGSQRVHRVMAHLYNGFDLRSSLCVCHKCDNVACVNPKHLFVGTVADNNRDMDQKGRRVKQHGADNFWAKLTDDQVRSIRNHRKSGWTYEAIGKKFSISGVNVYNITAGKTWKHLLPEDTP